MKHLKTFENLNKISVDDLKKYLNSIENYELSEYFKELEKFENEHPEVMYDNDLFQLWSNEINKKYHNDVNDNEIEDYSI